MPTTSTRRKSPVRQRSIRLEPPAAHSLPSLPLTPEKWAAVCKKLRLSPRQSEILELLLNDRTIKQIAAALGIAVPTVNTNLQRIRSRTGIRGRMQLAMLVLEVSHSLK